MSDIGPDFDSRVANITARRVRGRLAENDRTRQDAAAVLGLSPSGMTRRLKGATPFTAAELFRLSAWLEVPIGDLLPRQDSNLQPAGYPALAA